jgi:atypical dual specificity phosphatase
VTHKPKRNPSDDAPFRLFTWIIDQKVIGMSRPSPDDLAALAACQIDHVISLSESPVPPRLLKEHGLSGTHIPLPDMSAPPAASIKRFVRTLDRLLSAGHKVAVHCGAGLGRTGTMLACYLVSRGRSADEALAEVRSRRPGSVENPEQEQAVREFGENLRRG